MVITLTKKFWARGLSVLVVVAPLADRTAAQDAPTAPPPAPFDLLIRGAAVLDGTGADALATDVGIRAGMVAWLGSDPDARAARTIDARGLTLAPGFIDLHAHADEDALRLPTAESFLRMGVTSIITGNCGGSAPALAAHFAAIEAAGISLNYGSLIGHGTIRTGVMRTAARAPTDAELRRMGARVDEAMRAGAFGMSTGLIYVPGTYATTEELVALCKIVAQHGGLYATHMRDEGDGVLTAIAEALRIGREADCQVHLSHLKASGKVVWGKGPDIVAAVAAARASGQRVTGDQYVYTASSTGLDVLFDSRALSVGRKEFGERLRSDPQFRAEMAAAVLAAARRAGFDDLAYAQIASASGHAELNGKRMPEAAQTLLGRNDPAAQAEAACILFADAAPTRVSMIYHKMCEPDVEAILAADFVSIAADAGIRDPQGESRPHPRGSGNNPRVLGHYVRDRKVVSLPEAVRKMTSLPAAIFGLAGRGRIEPGACADLVLFDPAQIHDRAVYGAPPVPPIGIPYVLVNGVVVIDQGKHTGQRPGHVLRRSTKPK
jgi:N-acyl-D-amino-acid deacylase